MREIDLPDYSEFYGNPESIPLIVGMDHALWSIFNLYNRLIGRDYSNDKHDDALSYWIDCVDRSNRFWSTGIALLSTSPAEALTLIRSSLEASLGLSVPYHIPEERYESGSFMWMVMQFESEKHHTHIAHQWASEFDQNISEFDKNLLRHLILFLHKSTHCIPNKSDKNDPVWSKHVSAEGIANYLMEENKPEEWLVILGGIRLDILRYSLSNMFEYLQRVLLESFSGGNEEEFVAWAEGVNPDFAGRTPYEMDWMNPINQVRIRILEWVWPLEEE